MSILSALHTRVPGSRYYYNAGGHAGILPRADSYPKELLEVGIDVPREHFIIANYGDDKPLSILFVGEDAASMMKTLQQLALPKSCPSNLGERVLFLFRSHLKGMSGSVYLEQMVNPGNEHKLLRALARLAASYNIESQAASN